MFFSRPDKEPNGGLSMSTFGKDGGHPLQNGGHNLATDNPDGGVGLRNPNSTGW